MKLDYNNPEIGEVGSKMQINNITQNKKDLQHREEY